MATSAANRCPRGGIRHGYFRQSEATISRTSGIWLGRNIRLQAILSPAPAQPCGGGRNSLNSPRGKNGYWVGLWCFLGFDGGWMIMGMEHRIAGAVLGGRGRIRKAQGGKRGAGGVLSSHLSPNPSLPSSTPHRLTHIYADRIDRHTHTILHTPDTPSSPHHTTPPHQRTVVILVVVVQAPPRLAAGTAPPSQTNTTYGLYCKPTVRTLNCSRLSRSRCCLSFSTHTRTTCPPIAAHAAPMLGLACNPTTGLVLADIHTDLLQSSAQADPLFAHLVPGAFRTQCPMTMPDPS
ncbi:hypothetical protein B0J11DRAFT_290134 [Dendryphion nanum]|uniref:Uncharacterized protein n=1 Tax=Dendryphion nanum TaxID=256645 RepID=A0A9P9DXR7_9PLEO|nr:hypothetical protein B0J11DRAFT_290134 [Dendryphion nanum]